MYKDDCRLKGVVNLVLRDKDGKVKQHKTIRNKVTDYGIAHMIGRMIDDNQDKAGAHIMPRMMSHMGIGVGAAGQDGTHTTTSTRDSNSVQNLYEDRTFGTLDLKKASEAATFDRMLQNERGRRVQLMKDSSLASDYAIEQALNLTAITGGGAVYQEVGGVGYFVINSTSANAAQIKTFRTLRGGDALRVVGLRETASGTLVEPADSMLTIKEIISGKDANGNTLSGAVTIKLDAVLGNEKGQSTLLKNNTDIANGISAGTLFLDVEYVGRLKNKSEERADLGLNTAALMHPTFDSTRIHMDFGGQKTSTGKPESFAVTTFSGGSGQSRGPFLVDAGASGPFENDIKLLGIQRGRIGAFYEREIERPRLFNTDNSASGFPNAAAYNDTSGQETPTLTGYSVPITGTSRAGFPFLGTSENKPAGRAEGEDSFLLGTVFEQFGTSVDGIFQGSELGGSIVEDAGTQAEGYPKNENNYGVVGGLQKVGNAVNYTISTANLLNYSSNNVYTANAQAGTKKVGKRIVYIGTFKEHNPRLETDYKPLTEEGMTGSTANTAYTHINSPQDGVYPITEAGIFNHHKKDVGIFDIFNRTIGSSPANKANQDARDANQNTAITGANQTIPLTIGKNVEHQEVKDVLTGGNEKVIANARGFTQGPITQTMLCRTTFDPINKAVSDTLQITWSVQLTDNSVS